MNMHLRYKAFLCLVILAVIVAASAGCGSTGDTPSPTPTRATEVNGLIEELNGVTVLRVWGSRQEMGYAYGYLLADQLVELIEQNLFDHLLEGLDPNITYDALVELMEQSIYWPEWYVVEMEAMVEGIKDALGGSLPVITHERIEEGARVLEADMLALMNSCRDLIDISARPFASCSGFAAWGDITGDGETRVGGNWDDAQGDVLLQEHSLLIVRKPDYGLSTVSSGFIGMVGLSRGMNETGVAVVAQGCDDASRWVEVTGQCFPAVIMRDVLESQAAGPDLVTRITGLFKGYPPRCGAAIILFAQGKPTWNNPRDNQMAVVIESDFGGVTPRLPSHNVLYGDELTGAIVATNHYLRRYRPTDYIPPENSVERYEAIMGVLESQAIAGVSDMQDVLKACQQPAITKHSVYLEPDSKMIHVAFRTGDDPSSAEMTPVSFHWDELFAPIPD